MLGARGREAEGTKTMATLVLHGISVALAAIALMLLFVEVFLKLDRSLFYFGLVALALCAFQSIEVAGLPYLPAVGLFWTRVQHLLVAAAAPALMAYALAVSGSRRPRLMGVFVVVSAAVAAVTATPALLVATPQGLAKPGPIYSLVMPPFIAALAATGTWVLAAGWRRAAGSHRRAVMLQLVGWVYLTVVGGACLAIVMGQNDGSWSRRVAVGMVIYLSVYGFYTVATLVARLGHLVDERRAALEDAHAQRERSERLLTNFLLVLASAIESRDPYTGGHVNRVAAYSEAIARRLGLSEGSIRGIYLGAVVHDLGKIGVRDQVVNKTDKLDLEEVAEMRAHARIGHDLLDRIGEFEVARDIAFCHHERWDGTGYPSELKGEQIPLEARIVAVADYWDAIITDRPYRRAMPMGEAMKIMASERGRAFDPQVLDTFMDPHEPIHLRFLEGEQRSRQPSPAGPVAAGAADST
jgi:HD-GYP domain-containing protein (c-di-GMP phosphodiesterase class II)